MNQSIQTRDVKMRLRTLEQRLPHQFVHLYHFAGFLADLLPDTMNVNEYLTTYHHTDQATIEGNYVSNVGTIPSDLQTGLRSYREVYGNRFEFMPHLFELTKATCPADFANQVREEYRRLNQF
ncbi:hypothetical protein HYV86_07065 [Candidatus Woesearchaeota archaeon]|nr:hypothetical protein [Candidatus Woesearchaeota archaeon]